MSTDAFVWCQNCGATSADVQHGPGLLCDLLASAETLHVLATMPIWPNLRIELWAAVDGPDPVKFVARHVAHGGVAPHGGGPLGLVVVDEYGYRYDPETAEHADEGRLLRAAEKDPPSYDERRRRWEQEE